HTELDARESFQRRRGRGLGECCLAPLLLPLAERDLPRHIAVDGGDAVLDARGGDVVELDLVACQGGYMGDAAAHLAGADDAYRSDLASHILDPAARVFITRFVQCTLKRHSAYARGKAQRDRTTRNQLNTFVARRSKNLWTLLLPRAAVFVDKRQDMKYFCYVI